ncbi:hypothetical protein LUZ60_015018 [Juncus effusus]|nr:hypothetical protein LUZ60_015018 [Juncus effusus]
MVENPTTAAEAAAAVADVAECLSDDLLFFLEDTFPVLTAEGKQSVKKEGGEQEEEVEELEWLSNKDAFPPLETSISFGPLVVAPSVDDVRIPAKRRSDGRRRRVQFANFTFQLPVTSTNSAGTSNSNRGSVSKKRCTHCQVGETPQWREGPMGPGTLCNACGVRYKSGRLCDEYRPINSPTFSPGKHSNYHRKVVEMREGKGADGIRKVSLSVNNGGKKRGRRPKMRQDEGNEGGNGVQVDGGFSQASSIGEIM